MGITKERHGVKSFLVFLEKQKIMIEAIIFSYKNKNLKKVVDNLINNTSSPIFISILDKHNIDRKSLFLSPEYNDKVSYTQIVWDELEGPSEYKSGLKDRSSLEHFLILSDDTILPSGWDSDLMLFLENKRAIVSGMGDLSLEKKNLFFFKQERSFSSDFIKTNFADRNFIFGKTEYLTGNYPKNVKYYGEEELLSLNLFNSKVDIFSAPSGWYVDLGLRTRENKYTTFSLEHNYNSVIDTYFNAPADFLKINKINRDELTKLPYDPNDVAYNPYLLDSQHEDASKFLKNPKSII
jgi:hypothetical protein